MTAFEKLSNNGIYLTHKNLEYIISKYNIKEISVFGSSIRNDFTSESDVDFLIDFRNSEEISLFDILDIQDYLQNITKRNVDIVEPAGLVNPYRKEAIMNSKEPLYVGEWAWYKLYLRYIKQDIPWTKIIGLRNKIVHDYGEILTDRIWLIASESIPELLYQIKSKNFI